MTTQAESSAPHGTERNDEIVVEFDNVVKSFGDKRILDGLSLDVRRSESFVIMGPSGTGKSVTLRHVIGLMQPDSGRVIVEGQDMSTITPKGLAELRKHTGYLFQEGALINWLNVGDNVALPLRENNPGLTEAEIKDRVEERLELVHLPGSWDKMPSEISGGMKKRVGLARALITDPQIVLYDEPNAGLDPEISMSVNHLIRELADRLKITSLVITHLLSCVRVVADRVAMLEKGQVVVQGTRDEFLASDHPRLLQFLGSDPD